MVWTKKKHIPGVTYVSPHSWSEPQRITALENKSSEHVVVAEVSCKDILSKQLDPNLVTLKYLLEQGVTIDPGSCAQMLNITDIAQIEKYNTADMQEVYAYLQEHGKEILKETEKTE